MPEESKEKKSPILNFEDSNYNIDSLSDESKNIIKGLQFADSQIKMQEDTLRLLILGRDSLISKLKNELNDAKPIEDN
tara:strand:- start:187 stop:420 length:234 start_codon:yes stop_codon:yes gene_type:complete